MCDKIRVLIVDDSAVIRSLVSRMLCKSDRIEVAGTALNGRYALNKLSSVKPDLIVLDLEMPEMNGIDFLKECDKHNIRIPVVILSAVAHKGAKLTMEAMALGAAAFLVKPNQDGYNLESLETNLIDTVLSLGVPHSYEMNTRGSGHIHYDNNQPREEAHSPQPAPSNVDSPVVHNHVIREESSGINQDFDPMKYTQANRNKLFNMGILQNIDVVVIGISTGGPMALRKMLPEFPSDFPVPIVVVQHMPIGFTHEFAMSLDKICRLEVKEAADGDIVKSGRILIAPGHAHIRFLHRQLATIVQLDSCGNVNGHMPSASVLFESATEVYGKNTLACIMTGMGKDGADTIGNVLRAGGITIAQDQATSIVFGMPRIAIENGNIQLVRPLDKIAHTIIDIVKNHSLASL